MANSAKVKGDRAELEAAAILTNLLHCPVRRKLGAGRQDDTGDLAGVPSHVVQIANWKNTTTAARIKPQEAEQQRINANETHAATMVRFPNKQWRVVLTLGQWARYLRCAKILPSDHIILKAKWVDIYAASAVRIKAKKTSQQPINANTPHLAVLVRFRNKQWRVVLTLEQWARYLQHANLIDS